MSVGSDTIIVRGKTHGNFADNARVYNELTAILHHEAGWKVATPVQRNVLDMICLKLSRVASNPAFDDHWKDISGYAELAYQELTQGKTNQPTDPPDEDARFEQDSYEKYVRAHSRYGAGANKVMDFASWKANGKPIDLP